jgi:hypothetical protein
LRSRPRGALDIDKSETVDDTIRKVSTAADDHDDVVVARFGGHRGDAEATKPGEARAAT